MVAPVFVTKKEGIFLGVDEVISATDLAILGFVRKQFSRQSGFTLPKFSDAQLLELSEYAERVPFWRDNQAAQILIRQLRNDPDFLANAVQPVPGAVKGIQSIAGHVPILGYLTERDELLSSATRSFLDRYDLPKAQIFSPSGNYSPEVRKLWKRAFIANTLQKPRGLLESDAEILSELPLAEEPKGEIFLLTKENKHHRSRTNQQLTMPRFVTIAEGWKSAVKNVRNWFG